MSFEKTPSLNRPEVQLRSWKMPIAYVLGRSFALSVDGLPETFICAQRQVLKSYTLEDITTPGALILWVLFVLVALIAAWSLFCTTTRRTPPCWLSSPLRPSPESEPFSLPQPRAVGPNGVVTLTSLLVSTIAISTQG